MQSPSNPPFESIYCLSPPFSECPFYFWTGAMGVVKSTKLRPSGLPRILVKRSRTMDKRAHTDEIQMDAVRRAMEDGMFHPASEHCAACQSILDPDGQVIQPPTAR